ncbi:MAG TPA: endonuclease/exonuclease/phosphatase family protein [Chitinophagaceae bacterium]
MATAVQSFLSRLLLVLNFILAFLFLLAAVSPYLNPQRWWFISWLGFVFPFLFFLLLVSVIFWGFLRPKYAIIFLVTLVLGWKSITAFFSFHLPSEYEPARRDGTLRVVTWNVARFLELVKNNDAGSHVRLRMMDQLKSVNADILCMQEFYTSDLPANYDNIDYIQKNLGYPYYYFYYDPDGYKQYFSSVIFSRFPLVDTGKVIFPQPSSPEALLHADIKWNGDTIRIFTTHLQSVQFKKKDYERIDEIRRYNDGLVDNSRTIFSKIRRGFTNRSIQADVIRGEVEKSPYPVVLCGDFNDIPNSYTYFRIRGKLSDAFLVKGSGVGRTFNSISPTLRIDYILFSRRLKAMQFSRFPRNLSDHYMLLADFEVNRR